ncbi:hypothetical protein WN51_01466 [Melipona quadrifasciata]|uniref:Uncharacterized protein n=1 Tax=Melipona quadrifasciata TaxID=166423 RepID=A0A0M8ZWI5_9HYME|nr:hypothetical protein WN51_01466 [Melipona quadrifasciata]
MTNLFNMLFHPRQVKKRGSEKLYETNEAEEELPSTENYGKELNKPQEREKNVVIVLFGHMIPRLRVSNTRLAQAASGCAPSVEVLPIFDVKQAACGTPARRGDRRPKPAFSGLQQKRSGILPDFQAIYKSSQRTRLTPFQKIDIKRRNAQKLYNTFVNKQCNSKRIERHLFSTIAKTKFVISSCKLRQSVIRRGALFFSTELVVHDM